LRRHQIEAVVFQLMDDTIFISLTEEGEKIPPRKEGEIVHIEGDLSIIDNAVLSKLLKLCKPLLTATVGIKTMWVGPLPRYVTGGCCLDAGNVANRQQRGHLDSPGAGNVANRQQRGHLDSPGAGNVANRQQRGHLDSLLSNLEEVHKCIRDFLFVEGLRHARVMNLWVGLRGSSPSNIWGKDPVYIKKEMMPRLAEGVKITLNKISLKRRSDGNEPETKRGRSQAASSRGGGSSTGDRLGGGGGGGRPTGTGHRSSSRGSGGGGRGGRYRN
jgi:hypothetical protein